MILAQNPATGEVKYFVSNASANTPLAEMLQVAFSQWQVENWQASLLVVWSGQAGGGVRCVRSPNLYQPDSTLVIVSNGHVLPGRSDAAASGGKVRTLRLSKLPMPPTPWPPSCGHTNVTRRPTWLPAAVTIRNAMKRHTEADANEEGTERESSAAILRLVEPGCVLLRATWPGRARH